MAINHPVPESLFDSLNQLEDAFHLTGSRFFGVSNAASDYDYFAQYSEELVEKLLGLRFEFLKGAYYKDSNTVKIMRGHNWCGGQIDIQLVVSVNLKHRAQEQFKKLGIIQPTKEQWNFALDFVDSTIPFDTVESQRT